MELHPLCTYFPRMSEDEFNALKANLQQHGQTHAIYTLDGMILDGGNRYRALCELGMAPLTLEYTGSNPTQFILSSNLHRRHLSQGQSAAIVSASQSWITAQALSTVEMASVAERAKQSGVGQRTQQLADKLIKEAPAELIKEVIDGKKSLNKAIKEITPPKVVVVKPAVAIAETDFDTEDTELSQDLETDGETTYQNKRDQEQRAANPVAIEEEIKTVDVSSVVDIQKLTALNKALNARIEVLTLERDAAIQAVSEWKAQYLALEVQLKDSTSHV